MVELPENDLNIPASGLSNLLDFEFGGILESAHYLRQQIGKSGIMVYEKVNDANLN